MTSDQQSPVYSIRGLKKAYQSRDGVLVTALDAVSFEGVSAGITCVVGPTGSGKSTLLRILSGLEPPDSGLVSVAGKPPAGLSGKIGYLTQRHTLFPWMRIRENIGLPFEIAGMDPKTRQQQTKQLAGLLGLSNALSLYPHELSGGMQQRAALGRLLATGSRYWLMDEPFSSLDDRTRHQLQRLLLRLVRDHAVSVLFVTHTIDEAVFLADRVIVLSAGPGRVADSLDITQAHPRDRLALEYGQNLERVRRNIEAVLQDDDAFSAF
jgi:NitT/TauT family transport system ATP-binding protein